MNLKTSPIRLLLPVTLALLTPAASAQAPPQEDRGIDLVFLVDVSGSMYFRDHPGEMPPLGNDPERIRWDAVMLSMDLLTAEDRFVVIPFNQDAPAKHENPATPFVVPGLLNKELIDPRSEAGLKVRDKVRTFIQSAYVAPSPPGEFNGDSGGTAILLALEKARMALGQPETGRRRFVILITDGNELSPNKPPGLKHLEKLDPAALVKDDRLGQWLGSYSGTGGSNPEAGIKVYTFGLGRQFDERLLKLIAQKTGGHYSHVEKNGDLITTFRRRIWQLKGSWTKDWPIALNSAGREEDLLAGIRDHGILSYRVVKNEGPRDIFHLQPGEEFTFDKQPDLHSTEASYTYDYGNDKGLGDGSRFFTSWRNSASERKLVFSKRTVSPLLSMPDLGRRSFQRLELMTLRIPMDVRTHFRPSQFVLSAYLRPTGTNLEGGEPVARDLFPLIFDPGSKEFTCEIDLSRLPTAGGEDDGYSLTIRAEGKATDGDHALRDYKLELPPVDFRVENKLRLQDVGPIRLSNEVALVQNRISIRPERPFRVAPGARVPRLRVEITRKPVDSRGQAADLVEEPKPLELLEEPSGRLGGNLALKLTGSSAVGVYHGGELRVSAVDPASFQVIPLSVKFDVAIKPTRLSLNRSPIALDYKKGDPVRSEELQVWANGEKLAPNQWASVAIPRDIFTPEELWLEGSGDSRTRSQSLKLARPGDTFKVVFQPKPSLVTPLENKKIGRYSLDLVLTASVPGIEVAPEAGRVRLLYNAPRIKLGKLEPIRVQRGTTASRSLEVGLEGGVAVGRRVVLQCRDPGRETLDPARESLELPIFQSGQRQTFSIGLETDGPLTLTASEPAGPRPFPIRITVPRQDGKEDFPCGEYTLLHGEFAADLTDPLPFDLNVLVDDLRLTDPTGRPIADPVIFFPLKGKSLTKTIRVFAERGDLRPNDVEMAPERPFVNVANSLESRDLRPEIVSKRECRDGDGHAGVEIRFTFQGLQASFERYSGSLAIDCRKLGLKKTLGCVVQQVEVLRTTEAKPPH